jgi:hypothetical protein
LAADYFTINTILQIQSYKITFCLADKLDLWLISEFLSLGSHAESRTCNW